MKKLIILLLTAILLFSLTACGGETIEPQNDDDTPPVDEETQNNSTIEESTDEDSNEPQKPEKVTSTNYITIDGICVDDSYQDEDGSPLKLVYLLYTLTAENENLQIDSLYTTLTINESNSYESEHYAPTASASRYMSNYYYGSYIEDVYMGTSIKVMATFKIPEADLAPGRSITISDNQIPDIDQIYLSTDDIQHFDSSEGIAQAMDPEGYEIDMLAREEADVDTANAVKNLINGYYWSFYVNSTSYEIEFWADNNFEVRTGLGTSNSGTYSVRNGYIFCTYPDTGYTIEIPYELTDGDVNLDVIAAFDVRG